MLMLHYLEQYMVVRALKKRVNFGFHHSTLPNFFPSLMFIRGLIGESLKCVVNFSPESINRFLYFW